MRLLLPLLLTVAGCTGAPGPLDSGMNPVDAGEPSDAGAPDAGNAAPVDAGSTGPVDAGAVGPFAPNPRFANLPAGGTLDLGPAEPGLPSGLTDYSGFTYDSDHHRVLAFGGGHATVQSSGLYALDLSATDLQWAPLYALTPLADMTCEHFDEPNGAWTVPFEQPLSRHTYDMLEVAPAQPGTPTEFWMWKSGDAVNGEVADRMQSACLSSGGSANIYWGNAGRASVFTFETGRWRFPATTFPGGWGSSAMEYDPVGRQLVSLSAGGVQVMPLATGVEATLTGDPTDGVHNDEDTLVYSAVDDAFYLTSSDRKLWRLRLDRAAGTFTLTQVTFSGPTPDGSTGFDYDSRNQVLGGGVSAGRFFIYDPRTSTFSAQRVPAASDLRFHAIVYDPVNDVFLYHGEDRHTWAYRYR